MATKAVTIVDLPPADGTVKRFTWAAMANGDDGVPMNWAQWADRSIQFKGTFGVGGTVILEGSNDGGSTYFPLTDGQGNDISKTAAGGEQISEITELARPRVTAGDGTTSIVAAVVARRAPK